MILILRICDLTILKLVKIHKFDQIFKFVKIRFCIS